MFEYYNVKRRTETAAQNNGKETLDTRVAAMKDTIGLLQDAKSYGLLTEAGQNKYVKKTTREIKIGDRKYNIEYEVISLSKSKGKLLDEVTYLNQKLLEKILREGNFAFSMLTNSKNAQITSNFGEAQGPVKINPQKVDGKTYYYYEVNMHTGIDIINTSATDPMDLIASLFVETIEVSDGTIKMNVIGTDIRYRVCHLDTSTTDAINPGKLYTPGDVISDYPQGNNGKSSGTHYHIDVTCEVQDLKSPEKTIRVFVDPQTLKVDDRYSYFSFCYRVGNKVEDSVMVAYYTKLILKDIDGRPIYPRDPFLYKEQKTGTYHYEWYNKTNPEGWIEYKPY